MSNLKDFSWWFLLTIISAFLVGELLHSNIFILNEEQIIAIGLCASFVCSSSFYLGIHYFKEWLLKNNQSNQFKNIDIISIN